MAKKRPSKPKKGQSKKLSIKGADDTVVEIYVPDALWQQIKDLDPGLGADMIRSLFGTEQFGMTSIQIQSKAANTRDDEDEGESSDDDFFKVCTGP